MLAVASPVVSRGKMDFAEVVADVATAGKCCKMLCDVVDEGVMRKS